MVKVFPIEKMTNLKAVQLKMNNPLTEVIACKIESNAVLIER